MNPAQGNKSSISSKSQLLLQP